MLNKHRSAYFSDDRIEMVLLKLCTIFAEFSVILIQLGIKVITFDRWWDYHSLEKRGGPRMLGAGKWRLLPLLCQPQLSCLQSILRMGSGPSKSQRALLFTETKAFL